MVPRYWWHISIEGSKNIFKKHPLHTHKHNLNHVQGWIKTKSIYVSVLKNAFILLIAFELDQSKQVFKVVLSCFSYFKAISKNKLRCNFVGVTLGAPFIHPEVTVQSWINYTLSNVMFLLNAVSFKGDLFIKSNIKKNFVKYNNHLSQVHSTHIPYL